MSKTTAHPTTTLSKDVYPFSPGLAAKDDVGLNGAIVLSTIHDQLKKSKLVIDNHRWVRHPIPVWHEYFFPFWSLQTVERAFRSLRESKLLIAESGYNKENRDRTLWYRIDYEELGELTKDLTPPRPPIKTPKMRVSFSPRSTPASPKVPSVDVEGETRLDVPPEIPGTPTGILDVPPNQEQPLPPTATPEPDTVSAPAPRPERRPPTLELEPLPSYQGQKPAKRLLFVPNSLEDDWLYWSESVDGAPVARCNQDEYVSALGQAPHGVKRPSPHPLNPPNVAARLGEHRVELHVPRQPQIPPRVQWIIAKRYGWGSRPRVPEAPSSPRQTTAQL